MLAVEEFTKLSSGVPGAFDFTNVKSKSCATGVVAERSYANDVIHHTVGIIGTAVDDRRGKSVCPQSDTECCLGR